MDKRGYGSYEEVHMMLVETMQEACTKDESGNYLTPYIDTGFLFEERRPANKVRKQPFSFNKVAAIIIITLLSVNTVMLAAGSNESYGDGGLLHRIYEGTRGIFTDEDSKEFIETDETGKAFVINDFDRIEEAKNFWPGLYIPEYIPEGYELEELKICKDLDEVYFAEYDYKSNKGKLEINISYFVDSNKVYSVDTGKRYEIDDKIVHIYHDSIYDRNVADIYINDYNICIYGQISEKEIICISEYIN